MDAAIYKAFLQRYCMPAYNEFCAAKTMGEVGSVFSSIGLGIVLGGALALALWPYSKKDPNWIAVGTVMGFGGASLIVGIPLVCVGWKNEEKTINTFNNSCANNKLSLQLNVNNDGLGLALNF